MKCPYCCEDIMAGATVCKHCKSDLKAPLPWKNGAKNKNGKMSYDEVVDKVGLVPNVKMQDNLIQGIAVAVCAGIGGLIGLFGGGWPEGFGLGVVGGLIVGGFLSGLVLMFIGMTRKN
ncbi:MAG: hypothetical protein GQF41_3266 [Candidatus Rifleibacterium amylolyticum]|nr:MAG: hypothetical protein GQF41_3266 [Candidatus Rifleibacterium amylolyticum]